MQFTLGNKMGIWAMHTLITAYDKTYMFSNPHDLPGMVSPPLPNKMYCDPSP